MAVFTAAFASIAFAATVATTAGATAAAVTAAVASAIIATSVAVGVVGLAVTAVGMVTKNESLLKAGKIMGYVGLAGGLAGGAIGGIGGMMEGGAGFVAGAQNAYAGASNALGEAWKGSIFNPSDGASVVGAVPEVGNTVGSTGVGNNLPPIGGEQPTNLSGGMGLSENANVGMDTPITSLAPTDPSMAAPAPVSSVTATPMPGAVAPPVAPTTPGYEGLVNMHPSAPTQSAMFGNPDQFNVMGAYGTATGPAAPSGSFLSNIPDWVKYSGMNTAGQGLSGAASGWYAGASAEQKLEFDKLMNEQRQNQVQYLNKNNTYAPLLSFAK